MNAKNIFRNIRGLAMSALLLIPAAFVSCSDDDTEGGSPYFRLENTVVSSKLVTASSDLGFDAEAIIGDATDLDALVGERTATGVSNATPRTETGSNSTPRQARATARYASAWTITTPTPRVRRRSYSAMRTAGRPKRPSSSTRAPTNLTSGSSSTTSRRTRS